MEIAHGTSDCLRVSLLERSRSRRVGWGKGSTKISVKFFRFSLEIFWLGLSLEERQKRIVLSVELEIRDDIGEDRL
jgi:hypothetical protein